MKELESFILDVTKDRVEIFSGTIISLSKIKLLNNRVVNFTGTVSRSDIGKFAKVAKSKQDYILLQVNNETIGEEKILYVW